MADCSRSECNTAKRLPCIELAPSAAAISGAADDIFIKPTSSESISLRMRLDITGDDAVVVPARVISHLKI